MLSSLDCKLMRDMWRMRGQVLAIAIVVASAVATFVLALAALRSLSEAREAYYERNRFAHVFADMKRAPESGRRTAARHSGRGPASRRASPAT